MRQSRTWAAGTAAVSVLLVLGAYFLLIAPKRSDAATLRQQRASQDVANQQLTTEIAQLKAENASLPAKQAELAVISRQLPPSPGLPTLIRTLQTYATASGVTLDTIAPGTAVTVSAPTAASGTASATGTTGSTGTSAATGTASAAGSTSAQLISIPVSVKVDGTYAASELFLQKMQTAMTRAFLIQSLTVAPYQSTSTGSGASSSSSTQLTGDSLQMTIGGSIFVLPTVASSSAASGSAATSTATGTTPAATTGSAS